MSEKRSQVRSRTGRPITIERIAAEDGRYMPQAYYFVHEALEYKLRQLGQVRHLAGEELLDGIRQLALERFGLMARVVLEQWGVSCTGDFGEIVFLMIEHDRLFKTDEDSKEEFRGVYAFRQAFDESYEVPGRL